jgi:hypothetical protein
MHVRTVKISSANNPPFHTDPWSSHGTHAVHGNPSPHRGAVESRDSCAHALQSALHSASGARDTSTRLQQRPAHVVLSYVGGSSKETNGIDGG